jgi:DNA-binding NarL/FixJ family response regulator
MMQEAFVIDSNPTTQKNLVEKLKALGVVQIFPFATLDESFSAFESYTGQQVVIFFALTEGLNPVANLLTRLREKNPKAVLIPVSTQLTKEEVKALVQFEVDQILTLQETFDQLKQKVISAVQFRRRILDEAILANSRQTFELVVDEFTDRFYRASLSGWLTENQGLLPLKPAKPGATLFLDCGDLRVINSIGIKQWLVWTKILTDNGFTNFEFHKLRPGFLQLASFVLGFIPPNGAVNSFYLHYWADDIDTKKDFKFEVGTDYTPEKMEIPRVKQISENGKIIQYELDDAAQLILRFYKGKIDIL